MLTKYNNRLKYHWFNYAYKFFLKFNFIKKLKLKRIKKLNDFFNNIDLVVMNGPFSGMKYPSLFSHSSSIFPKIIGSYENELEPTFKNLFEKSFNTIFNIGSAEGYFAIGLAIKISKFYCTCFRTKPKIIGKLYKNGGIK